MAKTRRRSWVAVLVLVLFLVSGSLSAQQGKRVVEVFSWLTTGGEAVGLTALLASRELIGRVLLSLLLVHGNPTWSFYWREVVGAFRDRYRVAVPDHGLDTIVEATFPEQEMPIQFGPIYWEGTVAVSGTVTGAGFVDMTGYAK